METPTIWGYARISQMKLQGEQLAYGEAIFWLQPVLSYPRCYTHFAEGNGSLPAMEWPWHCTPYTFHQMQDSLWTLIQFWWNFAGCSLLGISVPATQCGPEAGAVCGISWSPICIHGVSAITGAVSSVNLTSVYPLVGPGAALGRFSDQYGSDYFPIIIYYGEGHLYHVLHNAN